MNDVSTARDDGLILDADAMLVLIDAAGVVAFPMLQHPDLAPANDEELQRRLRQGHHQLREQGGLSSKPDGTLVLRRDLYYLARVMAAPRRVWVSVRERPGLGPQTILHYQVEQLCAELTMPAAGKYRIAALYPQQSLVARLETCFPVRGAEPPLGVKVPLDALFAARDQADAGDSAGTRAILHAQGVAPADAAPLAAALRHWRWRGSLSVLVYENETIVEGSTILLVQGSTAAWLLFLDEATSLVDARRTRQNELHELLRRWVVQGPTVAANPGL